MANAPDSNPGKVTSTEYLLFTQSADGTWREAVEPYLLPGGSTPLVTVGTDGLATAVPADASAVTVAPGGWPPLPRPRSTAAPRRSPSSPTRATCPT